MATITKKVHLHEVFGSSLLHVSNLNDGKTRCSKEFMFFRSGLLFEFSCIPPIPSLLHTYNFTPSTLSISTIPLSYYPYMRFTYAHYSKNITNPICFQDASNFSPWILSIQQFHSAYFLHMEKVSKWTQIFIIKLIYSTALNGTLFQNVKHGSTSRPKLARYWSRVYMYWSGKLSVPLWNLNA